MTQLRQDAPVNLPLDVRRMQASNPLKMQKRKFNAKPQGYKGAKGGFAQAQRKQRKQIAKYAKIGRVGKECKNSPLRLQSEW